MSMETERPAKRPIACGTCRWYDGLGDVCRNGASARYWESVDQKDGCKKWEAEGKK